MSSAGNGDTKSVFSCVSSAVGHRVPVPDSPLRMHNFTHKLAAFAAVLVALSFLLATPSAEAQTSRTLTLSATPDRDPATPGVQVNEGDTVSVRVTVSGLTSGNLRLNRESDSDLGGTATLDADFRRQAGSTGPILAVLLPGNLSGIANWIVVNDTIAEPDETIVIPVPMADPTSTTADTVIPGDSLTITIRANDGSRAFLGGTDAAAAEGSTINVPVEFVGEARTAASTVAFSIAGTAAAADYAVDASGSAVTFDTATAAGTIVVAHTAASGTIPITITDDAAFESPAETLVVTLTGHTGSGVTGSVDSAARTYTITDDDISRPLAAANPAARAERIKQATAALNQALAAQLAPVIAHRFDPVRDNTLSAGQGETATGDSGATVMLLDLDALAELTAAQLEGLDSISPATESRALLQLLGGSGFSATSDRGGGNTLSLWGRGNYSSLEGEPEEGGNRYDYEGDSYSFYLGLDRRYDEYLLGVAVGYTASDLELREAGAEVKRSDFEGDMVAVYPYAAWQPSGRLSMWLLAGYGQGELEIAERRDGGVYKATSDTDLLLGAAGLSWRLPVTDGLDMLLRLSGAALHGEADGGRFDDGIAYAKTETEAQQLRGAVELGQAFGFKGGGSLRPYLRAGASYDFGDGARDAATGEFGTGFRLRWPRLGLETELEFQARLASKDDRDYWEYTGIGALRYDLGGDRRGLQLALRPSLGLERGLGLDGPGLSGDPSCAPLDGGAFGGTRAPVPGKAGYSGLGLRGELSYGIGDVRLARGMPGLLTLYGTSGVAPGAQRYGGGLRFEAERFALDAGLRHRSGAAADNEFLLDAALRF